MRVPSEVSIAFQKGWSQIEPFSDVMYDGQDCFNNHNPCVRFKGHLNTHTNSSLELNTLTYNFSLFIS